MPADNEVELGDELGDEPQAPARDPDPEEAFEHRIEDDAKATPDAKGGFVVCSFCSRSEPVGTTGGGTIFLKGKAAQICEFCIEAQHAFIFKMRAEFAHLRQKIPG